MAPPLHPHNAPHPRPAASRAPERHQTSGEPLSGPPGPSATGRSNPTPNPNPNPVAQSPTPPLPLDGVHTPAERGPSHLGLNAQKASTQSTAPGDLQTGSTGRPPDWEHWEGSRLGALGDLQTGSTGRPPDWDQETSRLGALRGLQTGSTGRAPDWEHWEGSRLGALGGLQTGSTGRAPDWEQPLSSNESIWKTPSYGELNDLTTMNVSPWQLSGSYTTLCRTTLAQAGPPPAHRSLCGCGTIEEQRKWSTER
ncbi:unnamed protein product [Gadus morhua 'NCC']